jgi:hypothetical protein
MLHFLVAMEADSTGTENLNDDMKVCESNELQNLQSPKVQSSQISSIAAYRYITRAIKSLISLVNP